MAANDLKFKWLRISLTATMFFSGCDDGTAATAGMGVPVGSKFSMASINLSRFKNGKATEHWEFHAAGGYDEMMAAPAHPRLEKEVADFLPDEDRRSL